MIRAMLPLLLSLTIVGCGASAQRLDLSDFDKVPQELERMQKSLEPSKAAKFEEAYRAFMVQALLLGGGQHEGSLAALRASLHDKTADQVIAAYEKMDPTVKAQLAAGIANARAKAQALKESNDAKERELRERGLLAP